MVPCSSRWVGAYLVHANLNQDVESNTIPNASVRPIDPCEYKKNTKREKDSIKFYIPSFHTINFNELPSNLNQIKSNKTWHDMCSDGWIRKLQKRVRVTMTKMPSPQRENVNHSLGALAKIIFFILFLQGHT